jgi:rRNA processing protein Gar1
VSILGSRLVATRVDPADPVYQLDDQTKAKKFVGKVVKVSGPVDDINNIIHVADIAAAEHTAE